MEKNKSEDILRFAVKRMLPIGPLAKNNYLSLKCIMAKNTHGHKIQLKLNFQIK